MARFYEEYSPILLEAQAASSFMKGLSKNTQFANAQAMLAKPCGAKLLQLPIIRTACAAIADINGYSPTPRFANAHAVLARFC